MNSIPPDIYERVHELAVAIVNASTAGDEVLNASLCQSLRAYYDEQASLGRSHPFLTEAVADFTNDASEAARLFMLSIEQAKSFPDEPTHTKKISLARELMELGQLEQAEAHLQNARAEAGRRNDSDAFKDAEELLRELRD